MITFAAAMTMQQRPAQDMIQKTGAMKHAFYECDMLIWAARKLVTVAEKVRLGELDKREENALIEVFALHARALIHFLEFDVPPPPPPRKLNPPHPTDMVASDVVSWSGSGLPAVLANTTHRINKEVAHLTYDRNAITADQKDWYVGEIAQAILLEVSRFLRAVGAQQDAAILLTDAWSTLDLPFSLGLGLSGATGPASAPPPEYFQARGATGSAGPPNSTLPVPSPIRGTRP